MKGSSGWEGGRGGRGSSSSILQVSDAILYELGRSISVSDLSGNLDSLFFCD